ncbi:AAA family ATPase [Culicoidibacter larvae]|uniref:Nucleotide kinase n=1 Tax=Culicoidibacter larvae TaxID=2579976 RepID=A0A5R8QEH8_9FIRM|nr:AAA family ATPase [Culicoidibacter larvae]TLG75430.1 nucleotide kinase [Culicoidibacter larvae]
MKKIIMINGTMGIGKSTVSKELNNQLVYQSVYLDGDWCWDMSPFIVNDENKEMVLNNIVYLLQSFLNNSQIEYIIFCWVMHEQEIIDTITNRLAGFDFKLAKYTLVCDENVLVERIQKDINAGLRTEDIIAKTVARLNLYEDMDTIKIDVTNKSVQQTVNELIQVIKKL